MQRFVLVALFALIATAWAGQSNDLIVGTREPFNHDFLLEQRTVDRSSIPLFKIEETVTIDGDGTSIITQVEVIDVKGKGTSATPSIIKGGPGSTFVTVHFESQRGHGVHFLVKVYGKK